MSFEDGAPCAGLHVEVGPARWEELETFVVAVPTIGALWTTTRGQCVLMVRDVRGRPVWSYVAPRDVAVMTQRGR